MNRTWTKRIVLVVAAGAALMTTGCSTMATIRTDPPGARVYLKGKYVGTAPVQVKLNDGLADDTHYYVRVEKEGYETQNGGLQQHWSVGGIIADVLLFVPTLGGSVYLGYFNAKRHEDEYVFPMPPAKLQRQASGSPTTAAR
jgi:hypothetical protein